MLNTEGLNMFKDFKSFILRGNTIDLAVAVVVGAAFNAIVTSLVKDIFTPLIAAVAGKTNFANLFFVVNHSHILYGDFINAVVSFLIVACVVFFLVVQPVNKMVAYANRNKKSEEPSTKKCPHCLSVIPLAAKKCAFCTSNVPESANE
jgi:large conductance mechanosensitive channel